MKQIALCLDVVTVISEVDSTVAGKLLGSVYVFRKTCARITCDVRFIADVLWPLFRTALNLLNGGIGGVTGLIPELLSIVSLPENVLSIVGTLGITGIL